MAKKTRPRNYLIFRKPRNRAIRGLNNICVIYELSSNALISAKKQLESNKNSRLDFEVPAVSGDYVVAARKRTKIIRLLGEAIDRDLAKQSIISAVAVTENYLCDILRLILRAFPEKLKAQDKKIDLDLVLNTAHIEDLISTIVERQIHSVFFMAPEKYFQYIEHTLSIQIAKASKDQYAEVKATRDLVVHNEGIINATYIRKAGKLARGEVEDTIELDEIYFDQAISTMKKLISSVCTKLLKKFGDSPKLAS